MATKHISDEQVVAAYLAARKSDLRRWPYDFLMEWTGQCFKVCWRAMERADRRGLVDYGVSLRSGWVTPKGMALLEDLNRHEKDNPPVTFLVHREHPDDPALQRVASLIALDVLDMALERHPAPGIEITYV